MLLTLTILENYRNKIIFKNIKPMSRFFLTKMMRIFKWKKMDSYGRINWTISSFPTTKILKVLIKAVDTNFYLHLFQELVPKTVLKELKNLN